MTSLKMPEAHVTSSKNYNIHQQDTDTIHAVIPKNIRSIPQQKYLNMQMFWLK